jgi:hypothetical protein
MQIPKSKIILNCLTCFREQNGTDNSNERYGNLSRADCGSILHSDSTTSGSLTALQQPHYGSVSNLTQQPTQNCINQQQLHFISNGNASQSGNTLVPQQLSRYSSARNIAMAQYGSPVRQQHNYGSNAAQPLSRYTSTRNVIVTAPQQFSSVASPVTLQGKRNIHNTFPATGPALLPQNETELLVKEIAMLNINQVWKQGAPKAKPGVSLNYEPTGSSSVPLVPHSSSASGSVNQQIYPLGENSLTSVGFPGVSAVCSAVMQDTRTSEVSAEKHFPPSSSSLCSQFQQCAVSPGKQVQACTFCVPHRGQGGLNLH